MTPKEFTANMKRKEEDMRRELPKELAETARDYFVDSFDKQGWENQPWDARKDDNPWPILVKSGNLKRSVEDSINKAEWSEIVLTSDTEYGSYHNDGTDRLPQREFMGESQELTDRLTEIIEQRLTDILNG